MNDLIQWPRAKYWTGTFNPVVGCKPVSEGCANCYAASMAQRFPELQDADGGFAPHNPKCHKSPPKSGVVFVGNMTDIFGDWNSNSVIFDCLHSVSEEAQNLVLTKRVGRMRNFFYSNCTRRCVWSENFAMTISGWWKFCGNAASSAATVETARTAALILS